MDETDSQQDPYGMPDLQDTLREQLRVAADRLRQPITDPEWTPEDQAELNAELARIVFNPNYANPDYPDRKVKVAGEEANIHGYNNFPMVLSIVDKLRRSKEPPKGNSFEAAYAAVADERRYLEISEALEKTFPVLYKRSIQLFESAGEPMDHLGRKISEDEVVFIQSQAYSAAADLARQLDPDYDLAFLR